MTVSLLALLLTRCRWGSTLPALASSGIGAAVNGRSISLPVAIPVPTLAAARAWGAGSRGGRGRGLLLQLPSVATSSSTGRRRRRVRATSGVVGNHRQRWGAGCRGHCLGGWPGRLGVCHELWRRSCVCVWLKGGKKRSRWRSALSMFRQGPAWFGVGRRGGDESQARLSNRQRRPPSPLSPFSLQQ